MDASRQYRLVRHIAVGGMAEVSLAIQEGLGGFRKLVVIKRILTHLASNPEFVQLFVDEARLAAQLHHPNVVQIFDLGVDEGAHYIVMEYVHGQSLRNLSRAAEKSGGVPLSIAVSLIMQACRGLHHAHTTSDLSGKPLGIIHRDVSTHNLLVGYDGHLRVADFGIARAASQVHRTRPGTVKGNASYMSPEQIHGRVLDARSDVFQLGIVAWELLTGKRLFRADNEISLMRAICNDALRPPSSERSDIPPALDALIMRALEKAPSGRFGTCLEMERELGAFLAATGQDGSEHPVSEFMHVLFAAEISDWTHTMKSLEQPDPEGDDIIERMPSRLHHSVSGELKPTTGMVELRTGDFSLVHGAGLGAPANPEREWAPTTISDVLDVPIMGPKPRRAPRQRWLPWAGGLAALLIVGGWGGTRLISSSANAQAVDLPPLAPLVREPPAPGPAAPPEAPAQEPEAPAPEPEPPAAVLPAGLQPESAPTALTPQRPRRDPAVAPRRPRRDPAVRKPEPKVTPEVEPPAAAPPPPSNAPSVLHLNASPWCHVSVDGRDVGMTPLALTDLPAGPHVIVCAHPQLGSKTLELETAPGEVARRVIQLP